MADSPQSQEGEILVSREHSLPFPTFAARWFERGYSSRRTTLGLDAEAMPVAICIIDRHGQEENFFLNRVEELDDERSWIYNGGEGNNLIIFDQ